MKTRSTKEILSDLTMHVTRISGDVEHIRDKVNDNNNQLVRLNGRVRENEKQISWMKGIGSTITFILGSVLAWFKIGDS